MNKKNYRIALRYARKLNEDWAMDYVHSAYIVHKLRTGRELFDEPMYHMGRLIKNQHSIRWQRSVTTRGGVPRTPREIPFSTFTNLVEESDNRDDALYRKIPAFGDNKSPQLTLEWKEKWERFTDDLAKDSLAVDQIPSHANSKRTAEFLHPLLMGYTVSEIASQMSISPARASHHVSKLKRMAKKCIEDV